MPAGLNRTDAVVTQQPSCQHDEAVLEAKSCAFRPCHGRQRSRRSDSLDGIDPAERIRLAHLPAHFKQQSTLPHSGLRSARATHMPPRQRLARLREAGGIVRRTGHPPGVPPHVEGQLPSGESDWASRSSAPTKPASDSSNLALTRELGFHSSMQSMSDGRDRTLRPGSEDRPPVGRHATPIPCARGRGRGW